MDDIHACNDFLHRFEGPVLFGISAQPLILFYNHVFVRFDHIHVYEELFEIF